MLVVCFYSNNKVNYDSNFLHLDTINYTRCLSEEGDVVA